MDAILAGQASLGTDIKDVKLGLDQVTADVKSKFVDIDAKMDQQNKLIEDLCTRVGRTELQVATLQSAPDVNMKDPFVASDPWGRYKGSSADNAGGSGGGGPASSTNASRRVRQRGASNEPSARFAPISHRADEDDERTELAKITMKISPWPKTMAAEDRKVATEALIGKMRAWHLLVHKDGTTPEEFPTVGKIVAPSLYSDHSLIRFSSHAEALQFKSIFRLSGKHYHDNGVSKEEMYASFMQTPREKALSFFTRKMHDAVAKIQLEGVVKGLLGKDPRKGEVFLDKELLFRMTQSYGVSKPTLRFNPKHPLLDVSSPLGFGVLNLRISEAYLAIPFTE